MFDDFITPEEVCELAAVTSTLLAQRRYKGLGPRFYKPTPKTVLYKRSEVLAWLEASAQTITGERLEVA